MYFSFILGNPPYQERKNGTNNTQLWPDFIRESVKIGDTIMTIHPGRWVIPTKVYQKLHKDMLTCGLKSFDYYPQSGTIFANTDIDGGISITYFKKDYNGDITYKIEGVDQGTYIDDNKFFSSKFEEEVYSKVFKHISTEDTMLPYILGNIGVLGSGEHGYNNGPQMNLLQDNTDNLSDPVKIYASKTAGKRTTSYDWYYIDRKDLTPVPECLFSTRKVMLNKKGNAIAHGKGNVINNIPQICDKDSTGFRVLFVLPNIDYKQTDKQTDIQTDRQLLLLKSLFMTKTARYLMAITQKSLYVRGFENIPDYKELAKLLPEDELFTDEWFYKTFDFSNGLIEDIETRVSPKVDK